jgi:hypothetical protein
MADNALPDGVYCTGARTGGTPRPTKVMVIVGENRSPADVTDSPDAPLQNALDKQCDSLVNMHGETHASESNYLALTSGNYPRWGLCDYPPDNNTPGCRYGPSSHLTGSSVFGEFEDAFGSTGWRSYQANMGYIDDSGHYQPKNCQRFDGVPYTTADGKSHMRYAVRHNPAAYYSSLTSCVKYDVPMGDFTSEQGPFYDDARDGTLPRFSLVVPDDSENGHDTSLRNYDDFLAATLRFLSQTPEYLSGSLVVVVTYDEGSIPKHTREIVGEDCAHEPAASSDPSCQIPSWVVGRYISTHRDAQFLTHYSILRTIEQWAGLPLLGSAAASTTRALDAAALLTPQTR